MTHLTLPILGLPCLTKP